MSYDWEVPDAWDFDSDDDDPDAPFDPTTCTAVEAGELLADALIDLKLAGSLSAKAVCTIAFWAHKAGACGPVEMLKWRPDDTSSGHFHRQFDKAVGTSLQASCEFYSLQMPTQSRASSSRLLKDIPVLPLHEVLDTAFADYGLGRLRALLADARRDDLLPPSYFKHPAVTAAPENELVVPLTLYMDSVPFVRHDAALGVWVYCNIVGTHHLVAVLRKSELCQCSCRHWCSSQRLFEFMKWCIVAMKDGIWPVARHDGQPFRDCEPLRKGRSGAALGWRAAVVFVKGDWAEIANTLGFTPWNTTETPCFLCTSTVPGLFRHQGLSPISFPHRLLTMADYRARVARCEIWRTFDRPDTVRLRACLEYDCRSTGPHGRALQIDACGLSRNDRLEPHNLFPNVGADIPIGEPVLWWRASEQIDVKHHNPLFDPETGIDPYTTIAIDSLHCLSLGVYQSFLAALFAMMIWECNVWSIRGGPDARSTVSVARLSSELFEWYGTESRAGRHHTRLQSLEPSMLGKENKPRCKLHGAETNGVLEFSLSLLHRHATSVSQPDRWLKAATDLVKIKNLIKQHIGRWPADAIQESLVIMYTCVLCNSRA